ncbi:MAG TPA: rhodanese-like domain-containing protein [Alphaproteobacteria bacterium]|nr:rhodanese-like domain-containing protein [Alphaproteobacteria bacterium]
MSGEDRKSTTEQRAAPGEGYGGDVSPEDAWKILEESPDAVLVDCRTQPEWMFVGVPDLSSLNKKARFIPWQVFPSMQVNAEFVDQVKASGAREDAPVLTICRSGSRSRAAAIQLTSAGFKRAYNVAHGFEGGHNKEKHRGQADGWKVSGLPWIQD